MSDFLVFSLHDRLHAPDGVRRSHPVAQRGRFRRYELPDRGRVDAEGAALSLRAARGGGVRDSLVRLKKKEV